MTYKEALICALTSMGFSEDKIRNHDYGHGDWDEHRRNELDKLYLAKQKLRQLKKKL